MKENPIYEQLGYDPDPPYSVPKPTTNADRIRSMSDEELAHFLEMEAGRFVSFYPTPAKTWLDWLRLEAKESIRLKDLFPSLT